MRGQSRLWHYDNPPSLPPFSCLITDKVRMGSTGGNVAFPTPLSSQVYRSWDGRGGWALSLCALTSYWCWRTKRTGAPWVVHKGFELDVSAGAIASDVQPAIHGWDPCALSHRHWRCISARHFWRDASLMSWKQGFFILLFTFFFFPPPRQHCT